jgi:hypothetical protein
MQKSKLIIQIIALCIGTGMCIVSTISFNPPFLIIGNVWLAVAVVLGLIPIPKNKDGNTNHA